MVEAIPDWFGDAAGPFAQVGSLWSSVNICMIMIETFWFGFTNRPCRRLRVCNWCKPQSIDYYNKRILENATRPYQFVRNERTVIYIMNQRVSSWCKKNQLWKHPPGSLHTDTVSWHNFQKLSVSATGIRQVRAEIFLFPVRRLRKRTVIKLFF